MKRCTKCGRHRPHEQFHRHRHTSDGLQPWCKMCTKARRRSKLSNRVPRRDARHLKLTMPADPVRAQAVRLWAAEKGITLVERRQTGRYPRCCKHGHVIGSADDEWVYESPSRTYRYCRTCRRGVWSRGNKLHKARKRAGELQTARSGI